MENMGSDLSLLYPDWSISFTNFKPLSSKSTYKADTKVVHRSGEGSSHTSYLS